MKYKNKNKYGFTLVELLVVIAIIGIISTIAITNLSATKEKAKDAVAKDSLNSILRSVELCLHDGGNLTTPTANADICNNNSYNKWPNLTENGWSWSSANSDNTNNSFCYTANKINPAPYVYYGFRCKESGCYELTAVPEITPECNPLSGP